MPASATAELMQPEEPASSVQGNRAPARRLKLCILSPSHWERQMGGAEYQISILLRRLLQLDRFDIHYITRRVPAPNAARGYQIHGIGDGRPPGGAYFLDSGRLWNTLRRLQPDIIYQRVACAHTGVAARYARAHGARMVWHVAHDGDLMPAKLRFSPYTPIVQVERQFSKYGARNANAIVVQTGTQAQLLKQYVGRTDATCIPNFHPNATETLAKPQGVIRVAWVANMKSAKRPEVFLRLARELAHLRHVEFVMVGQPWAVPAKHAVTEREIAALPNVKYLGELPTAGVNQLLAESHILVNTSTHEGFSNTFIQAWQRDVVVASLAVNPDGVFDENRFGVFAGGQFEKLRDSIRELVQDETLRSAITARARVLARDQFSERNIDTLVRVLDPSFEG